MALDPALRDDHDLAILDFADELGADDVERAGFGGQDRAAIELAEHERADAERIARADQLLVGDADEGIGALDLTNSLDEALDELLLAAARHEMQQYLGVGGRLIDRAVADQVAAQRQPVGQVAVMRDGEAAAMQFGEERLDVAQDGLARRRIPDMADGLLALELVDDARFREGVADEAQPALRMEALAVERDDARRLLATMLQSMEAERGQRRGIGMAVDAEDAAFLPQPVGIGIEGGITLGMRDHVWLQAGGLS